MRAILLALVLGGVLVVGQARGDHGPAVMFVGDYDTTEGFRKLTQARGWETRDLAAGEETLPCNSAGASPAFMWRYEGAVKWSLACIGGPPATRQQAHSMCNLIKPPGDLQGVFHLLAHDPELRRVVCIFEIAPSASKQRLTEAGAPREAGFLPALRYFLKSLL